MCSFASCGLLLHGVGLCLLFGAYMCDVGCLLFVVCCLSYVVRRCMRCCVLLVVFLFGGFCLLYVVVQCLLLGG